MRQLPPPSPYLKARAIIHDGDLLSFLPRVRWWRPDDWWTRAIQVFSGPIVHTAMAAWWGNNLMYIQMSSSQKRIGRLSDEVSAWPGRIIVSQVTMGENRVLGIRKDVVSGMINVCQRKYLWLSLIRMAVSRHMRIRTINPTSLHLRAAVCSEAFAVAWEGAGVHLCPWMRVEDVEPMDLYESDATTPIVLLV